MTASVSSFTVNSTLVCFLHTSTAVWIRVGCSFHVRRPDLYTYVPAILSTLTYEGQLCCPPWLADHIKWNKIKSNEMLAKLTAWPLRSCVFELVSHAAARYAFFSFQTCRGMFFVLFFVPQFTNTLRTQHRDPGSISSSYVRRMQTYCGPFCLSDYPKHKIKCWSKWPSYCSVLHFSVAPLCVPLLLVYISG